MSKNFTFKFFLVLWVVLWIWFNIRPFLKKDLSCKYKKLIAATSYEEKKKIITGSQLYEFILFVEKELPQQATYQMVGLEGSIHSARVVYFLYPRIVKKNPEYLIYYNERSFFSENYSPYKKLDDHRFIMRKNF